MSSIAKIFFLAGLVVILISSCGSDVDPGQIEGSPYWCLQNGKSYQGKNDNS